MQKKRDINVQKAFDTITDKVFLRFISHSVRPNQVTVIRIMLVPVIYWLFVHNMHILGLVVFTIAALTDAIDGAMARTRNQITDLGKVIDPIADKLLILTALYYIGWGSPLVSVFVVYIMFEMAAVVVGYIVSPYFGRPTGANFFGKIKLILQCISIGFFILGIIISNQVLISIAKYVLFVALFFAIMAGVEAARRRVRMFLAERNIKIISAKE